VWQRFGDVVNFCEPFFGSGAVLLARPQPFAGPETVNDKDCMIANCWRSVTHDPDQVAHRADYPINESDIHARHAWLISQKDSLRAKVEGDPDWFDAKIAGWWVWGLSASIGHGWCTGDGAWSVVNGELHKRKDNLGPGIIRSIPTLSCGQGVTRQIPSLRNNGMGVNKQLDLVDWMRQLSDRFRRVRVCCGDWSRITGPFVTYRHGLTAVFLDPPYSDTSGCDKNLYAEESGTVAHDALAWAVAEGGNPLMRIAYCSYGETPCPEGWTHYRWKAGGGYGAQRADGSNKNSEKESIYFSPGCLDDREPTLF